VVIASADKYVSHNIPAELWKPLTGTEEILDKYVGDAFGGNAVERLSGALADVLAGNKWLVAAMKRAQKTSGWVKLMAALVSVLGPRLVALGIIPIRSTWEGRVIGAPDMAGGGAYGGDRPDGGGEVRPDIFSPIADTSALRGAEEQGGFGEVPGSQNGSLSRRDARFARLRAWCCVHSRTGRHSGVNSPKRFKLVLDGRRVDGRRGRSLLRRRAARAREPLDILLTNGREPGKISVCTALQRPTKVSRFAIGEARHVISFGLEGRDTTILRDATNARFAEVVAGLDIHCFAWLHKPRTIWVGKINLQTGKYIGEWPR